MIIVYAKLDGDKNFRAYDLENGVPAGNIMYATCYREIYLEYAKQSLQRLCDENKAVGLKVQRRRDSDKKVVWESA